MSTSDTSGSTASGDPSSTGTDSPTTGGEPSSTGADTPTTGASTGGGTSTSSGPGQSTGPDDPGCGTTDVGESCGDSSGGEPPPPVCPPGASPPPPTTIVDGVIPSLPWDLAPVTGTEHIVASKDELLAAAAIAAPGDAISIVGGTYDGWGEVVVPASASGTEDAPIVIRSHMEPVTFTGATRLTISGDHVHVYGLSFTGVAAEALKVDGASPAEPAVGVRLSMIHCRETIGQCLLVGDALGTRFDHSLIEKSQSKGVHVGNESRFTRIDHNVFRDRPKPDQNNGFEQIQLGHMRYTGTNDGVDTMVFSRTDALVDHNVFHECKGEGEMIGIKTSGNKIVFNVIADAHDLGRLSFRGGPNNLAYGNVFRDTHGAVRLLGKSNRVLHNLVVDPNQYPGIDLAWGSDMAYQPDNKLYYTVDYIASRQGLIQHNTVAMTAHASSTGRALADDKQSPDECEIGSKADVIECTVTPFDNTFKANLFVNDDENATVKLSPEMVDMNTYVDNVAALGPVATLGTTPEMTAALASTFPAPAGDLADIHRALADFVWAP
ncbi:MAG TPA: chondroitinase-B domain-containing protein, partial [Nannocystis sp.]